MRTLEARELKEQLDEVLLQIKESGEVIEVTSNGETIARLTPTQPTLQGSSGKAQAFLNELDQLAEEVGRYWPKGISAVDAVRDARE